MPPRECVQRYRVASWTAVPTMIQDFFANPDIGKVRPEFDTALERRRRRHARGGGATAAGHGGHLLRGVRTVGDDGRHAPQSVEHAKKQCLGIPIYDVDSRVVDPGHLAELPAGEVGEIVIHGPQVFLGYWNKPEDSAQAFVEIDGKRFLRTGDLGRVDEDGYFFMVDRLKRMINASGFKVWPTEVESLMYQHPAVLEACVIGTQDAHRGETVKAVIVPRAEVARPDRCASHHRLVPRKYGGLQMSAHRRIRRSPAQIGRRQNHVARAPGSRSTAANQRAKNS